MPAQGGVIFHQSDYFMRRMIAIVHVIAHIVIVGIYYEGRLATWSV